MTLPETVWTMPQLAARARELRGAAAGLAADVHRFSESIPLEHAGDTVDLALAVDQVAASCEAVTQDCKAILRGHHDAVVTYQEQVDGV